MQEIVLNLFFTCHAVVTFQARICANFKIGFLVLSNAVTRFFHKRESMNYPKFMSPFYDKFCVTCVDIVHSKHMAKRKLYNFMNVFRNID